THKCHPSEMQRVEHRAKIGDPACQVVARGGLAGCTVATTGDGEDVKVIGEARGEVIVAVCHVLQAGQKDQGTPGTTPVEDLQSRAGSYRDEPNSMGRGIRPAG